MEYFDKYFNLNTKVNLILHCIILFSFLSLYFTLSMKELIKNAYAKEMTHIIKQILSPYVNLIKESPIYNETQNITGLGINNLDKFFSKPDIVSNTSNKLLIKSVIIVNIIFWLFFMIIIYLIKTNKGENCENINLKHLIIENIAIFSVVGIVEYLFFTFIAFKFIPVEPSYISTKGLELLQNSI
jgi:hypothetical protein